MAFELMAKGAKPVELAMQGLWLTGRVLPAGAVLRVRHEFEVGGSKNVEAVYCFAMPRDAALRRFQLKTAALVSHSELRPSEEALKEYERGIEQGSLSALARQYGDGLVNLSVGNIRPGEKVVVDLEIVAGVELSDRGLRLRFPFTLAPSYHKHAKAIAPEPGWGELELPQGEFGDLMLPRWANDGHGLHRVGFDLELAMGAEIQKVGSPSHRIQMERGRVALAAAGDLPDRDLVLDVEAVSGARVVSGGRFISAVIPSTDFGVSDNKPRDVVLLIDSSGSMAGEPFEQAKGAALACLAALDPSDRFGLAMFSSGVALWKREIVPATKTNRDNAREFLSSWDTGGGTELSPAIKAVAAMLDQAGGEVLLMTDGQVFGGEDVLAAARRAEMRLHTLGIGSASQDRMLTLLARETGGISRFVTPRERVDEAALQLFAGTGRPVATGLQVAIQGSITAAPSESVYQGTPAAFMGRLDDGATPRVTLRWSGGEREYFCQDGGDGTEETLRLLEGARRITDIDCRLASGESARETKRLRNALKQLSEEYGLASREVSLVAVLQRHGDVPGQVPHTMVIPVGLPEEMTMTGFFAAPAASMAAASPLRSTRQFMARLAQPSVSFDMSPVSPSLQDPIVELAAMIEDDGGMPGDDAAGRIENSLTALEVFLAAGKAFRPHARRVAAFLDSQQLSGSETERLKVAREEPPVCRDPKGAAEALVRRIKDSA